MEENSQSLEMSRKVAFCTIIELVILISLFFTN
jgi:hypothetical protein